MSVATTADVELYLPARDALRRRYARHLGATAFVEQAARLAVRFSDGHLQDLTLSEHGGSALRTVDAHAASTFRATGAAGPGALLLAIDGDGAPGSPVPDAEHLAAPEVLESSTDALRDLLHRVDRAAREHDDRVTQVLVDAEVVDRHVTVVTRDDVRQERRHLVYLTVRALARQGQRVTTGFMTPATSGAMADLDGALIGVTVARRAVTSLDARPAPIEHLPVIVGPGRGTVLVHEACCHPLEGDEVRRGSTYAARRGERIAVPDLTIVDDPTVPGAVGSYGFDDEGVTARPTPVVEDGYLRAFLLDEMSGAALGHASTGNGRVDGFRSPVLPRMSNTCVAPGRSSAAEIVADTPRGIYAENVGGGEVVEATGEFVFRVLNGYLVEDGRITDPIEETTVAGRGADVLQAIDRIGDDVALGAAKCGKFGQFLPVGVQGPTLRIASLLVGGTAR